MVVRMSGEEEEQKDVLLGFMGEDGGDRDGDKNPFPVLLSSSSSPLPIPLPSS